MGITLATNYYQYDDVIDSAFADGANYEMTVDSCNKRHLHDRIAHIQS